MSAVSEANDAWKSLPEAEREKTFQSKPLWKRALIVAAGPVANFLIAIGIFMAMFALYGEQRISNVVGGVQAGSAAAKAGMQAGDRIVSIDGRTMKRFSDIGHYVELRPKQVMTFQVERGSKTLSILGAPSEDKLVDRFGNRSSRGMMGISSSMPVRVALSPWQLPGAAIRQTGDVLQSMVDGLWQIITGVRSVKELGGPLMIAKYSGQTAALGWGAFSAFVAMISINLGFINLLPIPMLDGGHLFFYAIEGIFRRPVSARMQEWAFRTGFMLLMALMLFATFNDLSSFGLWQRLTGLIG